MPGLVGTYPIVPFTTPVNGDDLDAAVVVSHDNTTAAALTSHDADGTIHLQSSTLAARAGAGIVGRKWLTTDGLRVYYDTGAAWSEIDYLCKTAGGTVAGATTFSAAATFNGGIVSTTGAFSGAVSTGALTVAGGILNTGSPVARFEVTGSGPLGGAAGVGTELYKDGIQTFNRTSAAYATMNIDGADIRLNTNGGSGRILIGTSVVTSAAVGEVVVANAKAYRSANVAGTDTFTLISGGASNQIVLGAGSAAVTIGPTIVTGAAGGDLVIAYSKGYRSVGNAGTTTFRLIDAVTIGPDSDNVRISADGTRTVIGAVSSVTGSAAGDLIIANVRSFRGVNATGNATKHLISINASDTVYVGFDIPGAIALGAPVSVVSAAAGEVVVANNKSIRSSNNAGTGTFALIYLDNTDKVQVDANGRGAIFGAGAVFAGALSGITTLATSSDITVTAVNAGLTLVAARSYSVQSNSAGNLVFADNTAATNRWLINSSGHFLAASDATYDIGASGATRPRDLFISRALAMGGALSGLTTLSMSSTLTGATRVESGKFKGNSATPGIANGVAIGTGGAVSTTISGTDAGGKISIVAGNATLTNGSLCTVTFNSAYSSAPFVVLHYVNSGSTTVLAYGVANVSTTGFTIDVPLAPTSGQAYTFYYTVIQ
jgi:hypothetical protein